MSVVGLIVGAMLTFFPLFDVSHPSYIQPQSLPQVILASEKPAYSVYHNQAGPFLSINKSGPFDLPFNNQNNEIHLLL